MKARPLVRAFLLFGRCCDLVACYGRFCPLPRVSDAADVRTCEAIRPAAAVKLHSGSDIDSATTEAGESCKALADAFRFQRAIVAHCACSADASTGLSPIAIADDMTLRTSDIIAADDGFKIAAIFRGPKRSVLFRPLPGVRASRRDRER